jgi:hypothetical protein
MTKNEPIIKHTESTDERDIRRVNEQLEKVCKTTLYEKAESIATMAQDDMYDFSLTFAEEYLFPALINAPKYPDDKKQTYLQFPEAYRKLLRERDYDSDLCMYCQPTTKKISKNSCIEIILIDLQTESQHNFSLFLYSDEIRYNGTQSVEF